jgi:nicotinate-nucleotide pyrophosphorylase (carboxylating)
MAQAVAMAEGKALTEASGGISLATVRAAAGTGVDYVAVGALTHSAPSLDVALDWE